MPLEYHESMARQRAGKFFWGIVIGLGFLGGFLMVGSVWLKQPSTFNNPGVVSEDQVAQVARVIDGDSIELVGGQKVRYIGIDAPELFDNKNRMTCEGEAGHKANKLLVEGKAVRLVRDVSERDKYGRLLRYVYLGDVLVNEYLLMSGLAYAWAYPPDVKFAAKFKDIYESAKTTKKGLWGELCQAKD